jgi:hypothetical protein
MTVQFRPGPLLSGGCLASPATDKHPAQVEVVHEDKNVGKWKTIYLSGAIPARDQHDMLARVKKVIEAVKRPASPPI